MDRTGCTIARRTRQVIDEGAFQLAIAEAVAGRISGRQWLRQISEYQCFSNSCSLSLVANGDGNGGRSNVGKLLIFFCYRLPFPLRGKDPFMKGSLPNPTAVATRSRNDDHEQSRHCARIF